MPPQLLFDISGIDLNNVIYDKKAILEVNPQRGTFEQLDGIVYANPAHDGIMGFKDVRHDEFWVAGHFPEKPIMPGVLQIEAGAQMSCYLYNRRLPGPKVVAFLRIEDASFRSMVEPGDDLYILCNEVKFSRRRFISDIQGVVGDRVAFEARITGMQL